MLPDVEGNERIAELTRALAAIVDEARGHVAAGREVDWQAAEARIRAVDAAASAERNALKQLERVRSVHRARALVSREPAPLPPPASSRPRRAALRTRVTISGNMDVRRQNDADTAELTWPAAPRVASWEVRFSERSDGRGDYVVRESKTLPGTATAVEVPLGERPLRVHLLGRSRDGRLLQRALISGLTSESWSERWQRRASAS